MTGRFPVVQFDFSQKPFVTFGNVPVEVGEKLLARQWSVPEEKIRAWVNHYLLAASRACLLTARRSRDQDPSRL